MAELTIKLEEDCWKCDGSGEAWYGNNPRALRKCELCNGLGSRPSELGQQIIDLIAKYTPVAK